MRETFVFHKLQVWHLAKGLAKDVYGLTKAFQPEEKFGLTAQLTRAAISVASNIAEGSTRTSRKDQAHFTQLAYGSLMEVACQLEIACDLTFIAEDQLRLVFGSIKILAEKLSSLPSSQLSALSSRQLAALPSSALNPQPSTAKGDQ